LSTKKKNMLTREHAEFILAHSSNVYTSGARSSPTERLAAETFLELLEAAEILNEILRWHIPTNNEESRKIKNARKIIERINTPEER